MRFADDEARARPCRAPRASSASRAGVVAVPGEREDARAGLEMRHDALERASVQRNQRAVLQRPAEPRGREAEGRRRGNADHLGGIEMPHQRRADAVEEGIARGEHAHAAAAPGEDVGDRVGRAATARPAARRRDRRHSARWRSPPTTSSACATSRRAAGERPSRPSSPMPTMASHRPLVSLRAVMRDAPRCREVGWLRMGRTGKR